MDMSVHRRPRTQGEGAGRLRRATIAGLVIAACLIAVPVEMLELAIASIGLSEILPVLAPPIGWPVRIALALCGAAIAAAIVWSRENDGVPAVGRGARPGRKRNGIMGWTQNLGLHHLARLARGGQEGDHSAPVVAPKLRRPVTVPTEGTPSLDLLRRSRKDMHPDAPPRAPLVASRDLPGVSELSVIEAGPDVAPPPPSIACASPIRDTTDEIRPRPLPRSPAPLSDSDLSWVRGLLTTGRDRDETGRVEVPVAESADVDADLPVVSVAEGVAPVPAPVEDGNAPASLLSLVDRFEQGVAQRIALQDAANAIERFQDNPVSQPLSTPVGSDDAIAAEPEEPSLEIDEALNAALETLRKLSVKASGR